MIITDTISDVVAAVVPKILSDKSVVYDVQVGDGYSVIEIIARDERHAWDCAMTINHAINQALEV